MKIATFNVNGITARLPRLLEWLAESAPDIACLQELKTSDETFPEAALRDAGYSAVWQGQKGFNGVAVLARGGDLQERCRGLPGDPDDTHSRYLEASAHGVVVASIYLPNGNPQPGPKFDYKLAWFARLAEHAKSLIGSDQTVILRATTTSSPPTRSTTSIRRARTRTTRCCSRRPARPTASCSRKAGPTRSTPCTPARRSTPTGTTSGTASRATPACASTICCSTPRARHD